MNESALDVSHVRVKILQHDVGANMKEMWQTQTIATLNLTHLHILRLSSIQFSRYASRGVSRDQTKQVMTADKWVDLVSAYTERLVFSGNSCIMRQYCALNPDCSCQQNTNT